MSILAGQFQVSDPLFKRELRLPAEDYRLFSMRVGRARPNLTYDRGVMALISPREGTDITLQAVAGQGLRESNESQQFDRDNFLNPVLRISQELGPVRMGGFGYYGVERVGGVDNRTRIFGPDATVPIGS